MNRRGFLKSFAALAAAAVAAPALAKLAPTELERLLTAMRTGLIEDQTFVFTQPIELAFDNLTIRRCKFLFRFPGFFNDAVITVSGKNMLMENCHIDVTHGAAFGMRVLPKDGDMTMTLQSALNTVADMKNPTMMLTAGSYQLYK